MRPSHTLFRHLLLLALPVFAQAHTPTTTGEFIENRGQWDVRARYAAPVASGAWLFAEAQGLTYALTGGLPDHEPSAATASAAIPPSDLLPAYALRLTFVKPQDGAVPIGEKAASGQRHYLRGNNTEKWANDASAWQQLRYHELWPGIDFVLKANAKNELEYDLLLAPDANLRRARLRYQGAENIRLDPNTGQLRVKTSVGELSEYRPQAWQTDPITGSKQPVTCAFKLQGEEVSFSLGKYDHHRALVIDPVVTFVSYSGARVENWGFAATNDAAGNLYTAGIAFEPGYPTSTGAYQTTFSGNVDMVVVKYTTTVTGPGARLWATYLGGDNLEFPHSLLVNGHGELTLLGTTSSSNYPTTGTALGRSFQGGSAILPYGTSSTFNLTNGSDLILTRFSASGGQLRASTYLGGTGNDGLLDATTPVPNLRHNYGDAFRGDLALDPQGNVYVASVTGSSDFPGLFGAYHGGLSDGLVTSLDSSFSRVYWTTALGGSSADAAYSLQRDPATGNLYAAGGTTSADLTGRTGGYQTNYRGAVDGFVALLTPSGLLTQTTYLGTASYDQAFFVRLGLGGQPCIMGQTLGTAWPNLDPLSYANLKGQHFIQQLTTNLQAAGFATVFGSGRTTTDISPTAFDVDCYGRLFVMGWGGGLDPNGGTTLGLPVTPGAAQVTTDTKDFYLIQLSDKARTLEYATFYGTSADDHVDGGMSRFDPQGTLYQSLCACNISGGTALPIPPGANFFAATNASPHCDNAAIKLSIIANRTPAGGDTTICAHSGGILLGGSPAGGTWAGPGLHLSTSGVYSFVPDPNQLGTQVLTYTSPLIGLCAGTSIRRITVLPQGLAHIITLPDSFCIRFGQPTPAPITLSATPPGGIWSGAGVVPGTATFDPALAGNGAHLITYTIPGGQCPAVASLTLKVKITPLVSVPGRLVVCANDPSVGLFGTPAGGVWSGAGVTGSVLSGYFFTPSMALVGSHLLIYTFTGTIYCEPPTDSLHVVVRPVSGDLAHVPADTTMCYAGAQAFRLRGGTPAGGKWSGPGVTGTRTTGYTFNPATLTQAGVYTVLYTAPVIDTTVCPRTAARKVNLNSPAITLTISNTLLCTASPPQRLTADPPGGTWSGPGVTGSVATGFVFTPSPALYGYQYLTYITAPSTNPNQCPGSGQLQLFLLQAPTVTIAPVQAISYCIAVPPHGVVLTAQPPGGSFSGPGMTGNHFNAAQVGPGQHTVSYTYQAPGGVICPVTATVTILVSLVPPIQLPADTILCGAQIPIQLRATPTSGSWTGPGVTTAGVFTPPPAAGTSIVYYTLPGGCDSQPYRVTVPPDPTFSAAWVGSACADNHLAPRRLQFTAQGPQAGLVSWDFGDGSAPSSGATVEHSYATGGSFTPQATLPPGGPGSTTCPVAFTLPPVEVLDSFLPNIITPNGDGLNETFAPRIGGCAAHLQVFSRWGQKVFDQDNYANTWAGTGLASGVYYYLISGEGLKVRGWVELVR